MLVEQDSRSHEQWHTIMQGMPGCVQIMPSMARCVQNMCSSYPCLGACRGSFVSPDRPLDITLYASYEELQAFCQTWGLYGVKEMASRSAGLLADVMGAVDTALRMHEPLLQRLKAEYLVCFSGQQLCVAACVILPFRDLPPNQ